MIANSNELLLFISSLVQLPTCSALFPYTTLFRSGARAGRVGAHAAPGARRCSARGPDHERSIGERPGQDRKSTRLNSSHRTISYAVFCWKKKTKQNASSQSSTISLTRRTQHTHNY